jgi:hypothetical protein
MEEANAIKSRVNPPPIAKIISNLENYFSKRKV